VHKLSFEEHDKHAEEERKRVAALNGAGVNGDDDLGVGDEEETEELLSLDPKEWKVRHSAHEGLYTSGVLIIPSETRSLCGPWIVPPQI
jgi:hypothetical protein